MTLITPDAATKPAQPLLTIKASAGTIRLNLDLARFAPDCLDYVVLHELAHFIVPTHSEHFRALLDRHMPGWGAVRARLNEGPLRAL